MQVINCFFRISVQYCYNKLMHEEKILDKPGNNYNLL